MTLTTKRTISQPLRLADIDSLIEMYQETDSNKYVKPLRNKSSEFYREFLENKIKQNQNSVGFWVVRSKKSKNVLGTINLNFFAPISAYHIGCHLKKEFWNKGYATELLSNLIHHGKHDMSVNPIYGLVEKDNEISKRLLISVGMNYHSKKIVGGSNIEIYRT